MKELQNLLNGKAAFSPESLSINIGYQTLAQWHHQKICLNPLQ